MNRTHLFALTTLMTIGLVSGCKKSTAPATISTYTQAAVAAGGTLQSDGSVKNPNGSITEPNGTVIPADQAANTPQPALAQPTNTPVTTAPEPIAPAPSGPATAPPPPPAAPPAPIVQSAPSGTPVTIRLTEQLSASRNEVGDHFTGILERPIIAHHTTLFAAGTPVAGEVVASKGKGRFKGAGALGIELTEIGRARVHTTEYEQIAKGRGKRTGGLIGGGAGLGAIIGGIAGGGKGALIGGLAGAGGGTAASAYTGSRDVIIHSEAIITFRLTEPVSR